MNTWIRKHAYWYYNESTGESSWNQPDQFFEAPESKTKNDYGDDDVVNRSDGNLEVKSDGASHDAEETNKLKDVDDWNMLKATSIRRKCDTWTEHLDPASGKYWYYDNSTGQVNGNSPKVGIIIFQRLMLKRLERIENAISSSIKKRCMD